MTTANLPYIPDTAPFSVEQRAWLNGLLAGMFSGRGDAGALIEKSEKTIPVTILWGSQTGNSEGLARKISKILGGRGFAPTVVDMGDYDPARLQEEELLLIVTSTYGDGEPPDNAASLHGWLMSAEAPRLERLRFSVLALGDTNYPDFCKCGIEFDERLRSLGATSIVPRAECDVDFEEAFEVWLGAVESAAGAAAAPKEEGREGVPSSEPAFGKQNPFPAKLIGSYNLNGDGSAKETRHVELSLEGSGLIYEPGDALAVLPTNDPDYVEELLLASGLSGEEIVEGTKGEDVSLREALLEQLDVSSLSLKGLKAYAALSGNARLQALAEDKEGFREYAWGRQFLDLLLEEPYRFASGAELISLLPKLAPRLYSISSSPKAHPEAVHVTVGVVRYETHGRSRKGVCSNYLADLPLGSAARVYFHPTKSFKLPENPESPVIMVGPGTGIAPFRAFLEERQATSATGRTWLFFGDQHEACDFLYRKQLEAYLEQGVLTRLDTAFSRDQERKVYVQDRMREQGEELFRWLEEGGSFYVCGDAARMAKDVDLALHELIVAHGKMDEPSAKAYVDRLKKEKRYLRDVY